MIWVRDQRTREALLVIAVAASRFSRLRTALSSAADWQRMARAFSRALLKNWYRSAGTWGLSRTGATGVRSRMALKTNAEVWRRNGNVPGPMPESLPPDWRRAVPT